MKYSGFTFNIKFNTVLFNSHRSVLCYLPWKKSNSWILALSNAAPIHHYRSCHWFSDLTAADHWVLPLHWLRPLGNKQHLSTKQTSWLRKKSPHNILDGVTPKLQFWWQGPPPLCFAVCLDWRRDGRRPPQFGLVAPLQLCTFAGSSTSRCPIGLQAVRSGDKNTCWCIFFLCRHHLTPKGIEQLGIYM